MSKSFKNPKFVYLVLYLNFDLNNNYQQWFKIEK